MTDHTNFPGETITTVEEVEALPSGTILRGAAGQAYLILGGYIYGAGNARSMTYAETRFGLPMTVLYRPDVDPKPIAEAIAEEIDGFGMISRRDDLEPYWEGWDDAIARAVRVAREYGQAGAS